MSRKWGPAGPILLSGPGSCSPVSQSQAYLGTWIAATCHHSLSRFSAWTPLLSVHVRPSMYVSHLCELVLCAIGCLINVCVLNEWSSHDSSHWESLVIVSPPPHYIYSTFLGDFTKHTGFHVNLVVQNCHFPKELFRSLASECLLELATSAHSWSFFQTF